MLADGSPWSSFLRCWLALDGGGSLIADRVLVPGLFDLVADLSPYCALRFVVSGDLGVLPRDALGVLAFFGVQSSQELPCGDLFRSDDAEFVERYDEVDDDEEEYDRVRGGIARAAFLELSPCLAPVVRLTDLGLPSFSICIASNFFLLSARLPPDSSDFSLRFPLFGLPFFFAFLCSISNQPIQETASFAVDNLKALSKESHHFAPPSEDQMRLGPGHSNIT